MINLPLPAKANGNDFKKAFEAEIKPALDAFNPEIIYISAGFDAHINDPLADLALTTQDYAWITEFIKKTANNCCAGRIISSLEGGYHLPSLTESALAHISSLAS
jgi:acetoin utilization deacetylase AcuC-like enzyme